MMEHKWGDSFHWHGYKWGTLMARDFMLHTESRWTVYCTNGLLQNSSVGNDVSTCCCMPAVLAWSKTGQKGRVLQCL